MPKSSTKYIQIAPVWKRGTGYLGDIVLIGIIEWILSRILALLGFSVSLPIETSIGIVITFCYFVATTMLLSGRSIGKYVVKTEIISLKGDLTSWQIILRTCIFLLFVYIIPTSIILVSPHDVYEAVSFLSFVIFILVIIISPQHRGIHDFVAGTKVVRSR